MQRRRALKALITTAAGLIWTACRQIATGSQPRSQPPVPTLADAQAIQATAAAHMPVMPTPTAGPTTPTALPTLATADGGASAAGAAWPSVKRGPGNILVTSPLSRFYETRYRSGSPRPELDRAAWRLTIEGSVEQMRTLECISNPVGGTLIGNTVWRGVRLADVLALAKVRGGAKELKMSAADGYQTSIPIELALRPESLLVFEMDGQPLLVKHGYPARLLLPGRYGQKQPKWITAFEVIADEFLGYWESRGWSNECFVQANSQIWEPAALDSLPEGVVTIRGIAYASDSGVARVEVSLDNGAHWIEAQLTPGPSPYVWTEWQTTATLTADRSPYTLAVRATDGEGHTQRDAREESNILSGTFPDGASGIHRIVVTVRTP